MKTNKITWKGIKRLVKNHFSYARWLPILASSFRSFNSESFGIMEKLLSLFRQVKPSEDLFPINQLPSEIPLQIFEFCEAKDLKDASLVCVLWRDIIGLSASTMKKFHLNLLRQSILESDPNFISQRTHINIICGNSYNFPLPSDKFVLNSNPLDTPMEINLNTMAQNGKLLLWFPFLSKGSLLSLKSSFSSLITIHHHDILQFIQTALVACESPELEFINRS